MKNFRISGPILTLFVGLSLLAAPRMAPAQYFEYSSLSTGRGAVLAAFRKPGSGSYELVVKLANVTNLLNLSAGTTINLTNFTPAQLTASFPSYANLQWSVFATFTGAPNSTWANCPLKTIWYTLPRGTNVNTQSTPPARFNANGQDVVRGLIDSIGSNTRVYSSNQGTTNSNNNINLVRIAAGDGHAPTTFIADPFDNTVANFQANLSFTVEETTPSPFNSAVRADFYQAVPDGSTDPISGTSTGDAYYIGYFTLSTGGTMTFTRASAVVAGPPPTPLITSITRLGTTSTIFFTTTNGSYTYSLRFTNSAGLKSPVANWPVSPTTTTGNGSIKSLTDTTTSTNRFYRVGAQ